MKSLLLIALLVPLGVSGQDVEFKCKPGSLDACVDVRTLLVDNAPAVPVKPIPKPCRKFEWRSWELPSDALAAKLAMVCEEVVIYHQPVERYR